jgi:hypothetical protein
MKKLLLAAFIFILAAYAGGSAKEKKREPDVKGGYGFKFEKIILLYSLRQNFIL